MIKSISLALLIFLAGCASNLIQPQSDSIYKISSGFGQNTPPTYIRFYEDRTYRSLENFQGGDDEAVNILSKQSHQATSAGTYKVSAESVMLNWQKGNLTGSKRLRARNGEIIGTHAGSDKIDLLPVR